jgi:pimeloyl-ACP methyl ester carboxylesterase
VEVEEGRLYYEVSGEGHPLVLIHGAWGSHDWWRWQVPELSRQYQIVSLDVRGHGRSSPLKTAYSVEGFAEDLDILLEGIGIDETVLVGWSMGGMIAMQYCLHYPAKVKALILIATRGHRNPKLKRRIVLQYLQARLRLLMDFTAPRKYDRAAERFPGPSAVWLEREVEKMLSPTAPKEVHDWVMSQIREKPSQNYFEVAKSFWNWGLGDELKRIGVPALIMVGEKDNRTPPRFSRLLHHMIPEARLVIVEDAGHCLPLEHPERVNGEIIRFLKNLGY